MRLEIAFKACLRNTLARIHVSCITLPDAYANLQGYGTEAAKGERVLKIIMNWRTLRAIIFPSKATAVPIIHFVARYNG